MGVSVNRVYGIATYFTMFNTKPVGKHHLQVDTCVPGFLHGADEIVAHLSRTFGIAVGETTADGMFTLSTVQDLASCATGPVIMVNDRYFENMTIEKADRLIAYLKRGQWPENDPSLTVYSECGILLNDRTQPDCRTLAFYKKNDGYHSLAKARSMQPGEADAGLGVETAALSFGLDFKFMTTERRYDLVIPTEKWELASVQTLKTWFETGQAKTAIDNLGGFDTSKTGSASWVN